MDVLLSVCDCVHGGMRDLEALVEFDLGDGVALRVGEVVELGFESLGGCFGDLGKGGDGGREEDEQTGADEREVDGAGECAARRNHACALQELECQRRQDERGNCQTTPKQESAFCCQQELVAREVGGTYCW